MSRTRQNLRWKRKKPTLEKPKTYVGNSRFLGRVWRRDRQRCRSTNAALSFVQWSHYHSPFPVRLSTCGQIRGNGLRFARLCRPSASIRVLPLQLGRFARPCARSTYAYTSSVRSPAQLASTCFGPLGCGPDSDRAWHLGYWEAILAPRRSLREKPSPLPASSRRYAAQYFVGWIQPPRLASCSAAHTPNRASAFSLRSRLVPRPASRTTLVEASLSLSSAAPLPQRLSAGQPMVSRACQSLRL